MEANIVLLFVLQSYLLSKQFRGRLFIWCQNTLFIILTSSFMRHLRWSVKIWQRRKKNGKFILLLNWSEWIYSVLKIVFNFIFSEITKGSCAEVFTNLFETFSVQQVSKTGVWNVLSKTSREKRLFRS